MMQEKTDKHICDEMVTKIAALARLRLTEEEAKRYQGNFTELLAMFHELDDLPLDSTIVPENVLLDAEDCREDIPQEVDLSLIEKACPYYNAKTSYFDVPQFIEHNNE